MHLADILSAIVPAVIVGIFMAWFNRKQATRDKEVNHRAEGRKRESLLSIDLQIATAKLSYAVAMAHKRGEPNGEIEEGIAAYLCAKEQYEEFLREQATEQLN